MDERIYTRSVSAKGLASYEAVEKWLNSLYFLALEDNGMHFTVVGVRQFQISPPYAIGERNINERSAFDAVAIIEATMRPAERTTVSGSDSAKKQLAALHAQGYAL